MSEEKNLQEFPLGRQNFILIAAGVVVVQGISEIILSLILMKLIA